MAVGLNPPTPLSPVAGVRIGTASAGIKKPGRRDLVIMELSPGCHCAAVFTRNAFCAAPVIVAREHLAAQTPRYLLINTGNANAGTGATGLADARSSCAALAQLTGCADAAVLPFSTGVIGEPLPVSKLTEAMPQALAQLADDGWNLAAEGIMTTDTVPKGASAECTIGGKPVTITGIAKGAGMIRPDMATMLAFVATDADIESGLLQDCLNTAVDASFNCISVDGDTSTNDACVLVATGQSGAVVRADDDAGLAAFTAALRAVCITLAQAIVRDGEGATKFITLDVQGGASVEECRQVAYTIAHSPLVKTACFASDPNWGRILAAVGRAGLADLVIERIVIHLDNVCIVRDGGRATDYREALGAAVVARPEFTIRVDLSRGNAAAVVWTCDFSYDYVRINAEYRT